MTAKVCLIIVDGLREDVAHEACHWLMDEATAGRAGLWRMQACLPTISAPLYETLHTGLTPDEHGLMDNESLRPSPFPSIFSTLRENGRRAGVVAHSFFHTLYGGSVFDPFQHLEIEDPSAPIAYARYYTMDNYDTDNTTQPAEIDLCAQTWSLANRHKPDYLLLHSCSCDTIGHIHTGHGAAYARQAEKVDAALAQLIPRLRDAGYAIFVTSDHGMDEHGEHGGDADCLRHVPFFAFHSGAMPKRGVVLAQEAVAPTVLALLGLAAPSSMTRPTLFPAPVLAHSV